MIYELHVTNYNYTMEIKTIRNTVSRTKLKKIAENQFGDFVKAVVDVEKEILAIGGELHADGETLLIEQGSQSKNLWGINLYPKRADDELVEFDSMINIKPAVGNRSRGVEDIAVREKILMIVNQRII